MTVGIHLPLCQLLQDFSHARYRILLPRGWFKTTVASIARPIWKALPRTIEDLEYIYGSRELAEENARNLGVNYKQLIVQNTATNAESKLRSIREHFESNEMFRAIFPDILPTRNCRWTNDSLQIPRTAMAPEGTFDAAGTNTQVTSRHYDGIDEDDTVAPDYADLGELSLVPTKQDIERAIGWHRLASPLLVHPSKSEILVIGTRWFEKDLLSWIAEWEPFYYTYERAVTESVGPDGRRVADIAGELAFPERFDQQTIDSLKASLGPYMYSCLYLNKPMSSSSMTFRKEWIQYYDTVPRDVIVYTTVDPAGNPRNSKNNDLDYNIVMTCAKDLISGRVYVLQYTRAHGTPGDLINYIFDHVRLWNPVRVGIESVAYQSTIEYWVRERMRKENLYFSIDLLTHGRKSKEFRIRALQPLVLAGMLLFKTHMHEMFAEMETFPLGSHDDLLDCLSMQLGMWNMTKSIKEKTEEAKDSPLSVNRALKEIRNRRKQNEGILYDVLDPFSQSDEALNYALETGEMSPEDFTNARSW